MLLLAGCNSDEISLATNAKANQPVPPKLIADMTAKDMDLQSPILVRLFKQEAELEVWKQDRSGRFALLKTYPICRWSGDLGPKVREGDRQAPEGFYTISPAQMNPQSAYYLSFNTGYPNAFDKALGRTGSQLMVHGDCSSRGCYAMTDEQIAEIYSLGRESFFGGQKSFQLQAYPFQMTPINMAKHRNNPNMPFWKMIKEGYDHFEVTRQEPKVDFCEKKYVFDADQGAERHARSGVRRFGQMPGLRDPRRNRRRRAREAAADMRRDRQADRQGHAGRADQYRHRRRHEQGVRRARARRQHRPVRRRRRPEPVAAGAVPRARHHSLPRQSAAAPSDNLLLGAPEEPKLAAAAPAPAACPRPTRVANAAPTAQNDGFFSSLARKVGLGGAADATASTPPPPAKPKVIEAKRTEPPRPEAAAPKTAAPKPTQAGRQPSAAEAVGLRYAAAARAAPRTIRSPVPRRSCRRTRSTAASGRRGKNVPLVL